MFLGDEESARAVIAKALSRHSVEYGIVLVEAADIEATYGDPKRAEQLLNESETESRPLPFAPVFGSLVAADLKSRTGDAESARRLLDELDPTRPGPLASFTGRWHLASARVEARAGRSPDAPLKKALNLFEGQRAHYWVSCAQILEAVMTPDAGEMNEVIQLVIGSDPVYLTVCADDVVLRLGDLNPNLAEAVMQQALKWSARWRPVLRYAMQLGDSRTGGAAAQILDQVGEAEDVARLRSFAKSGARQHRGSLGRGLARRLAPIAQFDDLGHVTLRIGDRVIDGPRYGGRCCLSCASF